VPPLNHKTPMENQVEFLKARVESLEAELKVQQAKYENLKKIYGNMVQNLLTSKK